MDLFHYEENDVGIRSGDTMGWGALKRSSVKDATYLTRSKLASTIRFFPVYILEHHTCYRKLRSVVIMDENLMCAGDMKPLEQNSVVNNLMKSIIYN